MVSQVLSRGEKGSDVPLPGPLSKLARTREPHGVVSHFFKVVGDILQTIVDPYVSVARTTIPSKERRRIPLSAIKSKGTRSYNGGLKKE